MVQRTIASFFTLPKPPPAAANPAAAADEVLRDASNSKKRQEAEATPATPAAAAPAAKAARTAPTAATVGGGGSSGAKAARPRAPRPFAKGADVQSIDKAEYNDAALEFCTVDGKDHLLCAEAWACNDLTKPAGGASFAHAFHSHLNCPLSQPHTLAASPTWPDTAS